MGERFKSKFFLSHSNFWFVPYRDRDNFPENDDLFPIGVFPIGTEDCILKILVECAYRCSFFSGYRPGPKTVIRLAASVLTDWRRVR